MGKTPVQIDHTTREFDNRIDLFKKAVPRTDVLMLALTNQNNDIEEMFFDLLTKRSIDNATGINLDIIGKIIGLSRYSGQTDTSYRLDLKAWVKYLFSQGEINTLTFVLQNLTDSVNVILEEYFPGAVIMFFDGTILNADNLHNIMDNTAAGGIRLDLIWFDSDRFRYDSGPGFDIGLYAFAIGG